MSKCHTVENFMHWLNIMILTNREIEVEEDDKVENNQVNIFKVDVDILVVKVNNVIYLTIVHMSHGVWENTLQLLSQSPNKPVNGFHNVIDK